MSELPILPLLSELGLKPVELMILGMLWQNIRSTNVLMEKLVKKVNELEVKFNALL
ncbi:hypothetical protein AB4250_14820 [Vibrio cyclitrophicus]